MQKDCKDWFVNWFDTNYYHLLYNKRNFAEAEQFISNIIQKLSLPKGAKLLDNACGKGRHAIYLNQLGYDVTGLDLSKHSIDSAKVFENPTLHFAVHDMRNIYQENTFDGVFNLFTSFGYFDSDADDMNVLQSAYAQLKHGGILVLDFFNTYPIIRKFEQEREIEFSEKRDAISFDIRKFVQQGYIIKEITVHDANNQYQFSEKVRLYTKEELENFFKKLQMPIEYIWGNYQLDTYQESDSDRMIFVAKKTI